MNIGQASKLSGLSSRMIRHYEASGITRRTARRGSGYRHFGADDIAALRVIRNARELRFGLAEIRQIVEFWRAGSDSGVDIKTIVNTRLGKLRVEEARLRASRVLLEGIKRIGCGNPGPQSPLVSVLTGSPIVAKRPRKPGVNPPGGKGEAG